MNIMNKKRGKKLIIAHKGAFESAGENTINAFKKAIAFKVDIIEMDLRKTSDGVIIIFHDNKIKNKKIIKLRYGEIKKKNKEIPTLEEVLKCLKGKIKIDFHLKEKGYEKEVVEKIFKYMKKKDFFISSEYESSLRKIKKDYGIKTGLIIDVNLKNAGFIPFGYFPKKKIKDSRADFIEPRWEFVNRKFLIKSQKFKKPVFPWVVNRRRLIKRFLKEKMIKGIITDRLDLVQESLYA